MTMTKNETVPEIKEETHEGTVFFPLPDGSAILYNLIGKSDAPQPAGVLDVSVQAKKTIIKILTVKNWIK